jgi:hypothetical protein
MQAIQDMELEDGTLTIEEILAKVPERMAVLGTPIPADQPHTIEEVERLANGYI